MCFIPHLGFGFYKDNKIVFKVNVCLDCNYLIPSIKIPATSFYKINKGTEFEYPAQGFSEYGKERIIEISKELELDYGKIILEKKE